MADASRYGYKDLSHPAYQDSLASNNNSTLRLVKTVADFAQKVSSAHEEFSRQMITIVELFKKKNYEINQDSVVPEDRPCRITEQQNSLLSAWESLLQETHYDAQAHADAATLIVKNVYTPLVQIVSYKKTQSRRLLHFRDSCEQRLVDAADNIKLCESAYCDAYRAYRSNMSGRDAAQYLSDYHNTHNEYILQLKATNQQEQQYRDVTLPHLLEELEEINIDLANTVNGSLESHVLLLLTKANEQARRFDSILQQCKRVNPQADIHSFLFSLCHPEKPQTSPRTRHAFNAPNDPAIPGSELSTLQAQLVIDKHTEPLIASRRLELQKEAVELTSILRQHQDVSQSLVSVCQRNLANHMYSKVYETQDDLCRKRNEIRLANLQLAAIRSQIELLSGKAGNGSALEMEVDGSSKVSGKGSIKGMWKKAFKNLKTKDKTSTRGGPSDGEASSAGALSAASSPGEKPEQYKRTTSRQSSVKKGFFRKDSKESPREEAETPEDHVGSIDPVYSLLKCAADRSRTTSSSAGSQSKHAHACCSRVNNGSSSNDVTSAGGALTANGRNNTSRSSSPSSGECDVTSVSTNQSAS